MERDQRLVVGDGARVAGLLREVGAHLQGDHDRQLRQVEDGEQQWPGRLVEADDVAGEQPDDDEHRHADEDVHRPHDRVHDLGDAVEQPAAAVVL